MAAITVIMDEERDTVIKQNFDQGLKYKEILEVLLHEEDIRLSERQLKRILKRLNLSKRNYSNIKDVVEFIHGQLRSSGQSHGYRIMLARCQQNGYKARANDVRMVLKYLDPVGVALRTAKTLRRRAYYADGPNFIWHVDGYDKLKPFGLCISGCICGFSRKVIWLKVYHTNNDPRVIGGYFLQAVEEFGGCPKFVRSDYGTENGHMCMFQTFFQDADEHEGDVQSRQPSFIYGASTTNQRIESWWGYLRKEHLHYWIELFKSLQENGDFSGDFLDKNIVLFCFLALIQVKTNTAV